MIENIMIIFMCIVYLIIVDMTAIWIINGLSTKHNLTIIEYLRNRKFDHIKNLSIGPSNISGEGVFTNKKIKKGTVVVTSNAPDYFVKFNDGSFVLPDKIEYKSLLKLFQSYGNKPTGSNLTRYSTIVGNFCLLKANRDIKKGEELTYSYGPYVWFSLLSGSIVSNYCHNDDKLSIGDPEKDLKIVQKVAKKMGDDLNIDRFIKKIEILKEI